MLAFLSGAFDEQTANIQRAGLTVAEDDELGLRPSTPSYTASWKTAEAA